jgi:hypothetical protein
MKTRVYVVVLLICLFANAAMAQEEKHVEEAFWSYVDATAKSDGGKVADFFSEYALVYWGKLVKAAVGLEREDLLERPTYQISTILFIRNQMGEHPEIKKMTGKEYLALSYSKGWNSKKALSVLQTQRELFRIIPNITGDHATLDIKYGETLLPSSLSFIKENGRWKVDGEKQFSELEKKIESQRKDAGIGKAELCERIFEAASGYPIPEELWDPVMK